MAAYDQIPISVNAAPILRVRKIVRIDVQNTGKIVTILSVSALDSTHVRVDFSIPVKSNSALTAEGNYVFTPALNVSDVTPEAAISPSYVVLTVSEMENGLDYDLEIQGVEGA
jgi:hypothetical protein